MWFGAFKAFARYARAGRPMLMSALNGFRSCVFCYGQTGAPAGAESSGWVVQGEGAAFNTLLFLPWPFALQAFDPLRTVPSALLQLFAFDPLPFASLRCIQLRL